MGSSIITSRLAVASILFLISSELLAQENIQDQYQQFYDQTSTWENYKMVKKPALTQFWRLVTDTLDVRQQLIENGRTEINELNSRIDELTVKLGETETALAGSEELNDSIGFFGVQMSKAVYNILVWAIIAGLAVLAGGAYLMFQRSNAVTRETREAFEKLETQFDDHREKSRESQVKLKRELQTALNTLQEQKVR